MWAITKVTDEADWFERYVRLALSVRPPALPQKRHRLGSVTVQWHECEPGVAFIDARGGTPDDRVLATQYLKSMLAGHGFRQAQYAVDYSDEPDLTKTAKWSDIMAKAKRLIQSGKVQLLRVGAQNVVGSVVGDHGTYQTEFSREDPNSQSMTQWQCDCPWDQYAWQRTRQWKKYEGRPCAHVLATWWAAQTHPVDEDAHPALQTGPAPPNMAVPPGQGQNVYSPDDPFSQPGVAPVQPQSPMAPMPAPGTAQGTPPVPGLPPEVLPPFPMEGQMGEQPPPQVSIPGAKPQSPLNPVQWPGGTLSSTGWDTQVFSASPFNTQPEGFANGNMVEILGTDSGVAEGPDANNVMHGQYLDIRSNTKGIGEVMGMDNVPGLGELVEVIFPLDKTGELQPYHIRAWLRPDQLRLRPDIRRPGPMIKRRREVR